ncbi:hypothetical protein [Arsenophonus endosymbiont of Bemisia tabaci]|nr:hypothetical protein [Arsenophonus endosymbiont of Bemisia tabaci]CAA2929604.1 hypothetical protein ARSQ2_00705 [Arsenophonus endosymbiont of Bemisia tabaci Q2]
MQKKSARMRHRYFVRTQYRVIKIKSLSYNLLHVYLPNRHCLDNHQKHL